VKTTDFSIHHSLPRHTHFLVINLSQFTKTTFHLPVSSDNSTWIYLQGMGEVFRTKL
jgi:hypothetical protein